ncbi:MAG: LacI family DNA-binding transcriptional regulator [Aquincola tertiaricarbonis]|uniref:LacI family DNA-binding transcriptional regulator n=1 Tax=Aquincola tertiaricarbonis TaxID=391953 RepID=UPI000614C9DA|nr:substrate-binding domain-containing protein [Aquincola tertiaricarbonis]
MPIDLKQLSARLGLSATTVSRALNGYDDVSAKTRERVERMARELGYQPNRTARRLARGQADAVGLVYPLDAGDLGDPRFLEVIEGLSDRLEAAQMDLLLASAREHSELRTYERLVSGGRVDGVIVARTRVQDPRIDYLLQAGMPFVAYGRTARSDGFAWFDFDNEAGMVLAVQQLLAAGHTRIGYLHAPLELSFALQRYSGFQRAMQMAGVPVDPAQVVAGGLSRRTGYAAAQALLAVHPRPTALIADNNLCGVGAVRCLLDGGIAIGREVSAIVYDGVPDDTLLVGRRIAAIGQPTAYGAGETLAEMLLTLVQGGTLAEPRRLLQPVFEPGDSIGPPAG